MPDVGITDTARLDFLERRIFENKFIDLQIDMQEPDPYSISWRDQANKSQDHYGKTLRDAIDDAILNPEGKES